MIAEDQNKALLYLAEVFKGEENYKNFLIFREKGIKKQAFAYLDAFIKDFQQKNEDQQLEFIVKFFSCGEETLGTMCYVGLPYPLQ